jgi:hypothetical protein
MPASLTVTGGEVSSLVVGTCGDNGQPTSVLQQSTPVNSVFPQPITVQVTDANSLGVPNATVNIVGQNLSPTHSSYLTDSNGLATIILQANGLVYGPTTAIISVSSPDPNALSCAVSSQYLLQNTPSTPPSSTSGVQSQINVFGKTGPAASRVWNLFWAISGSVKQSITALAFLPSGTPSSVTNDVMIEQTQGSTCTPTITSVTQPTQQGGPTTYDFSLGLSFSGPGCQRGYIAYDVNFNATATLTLDDGSSYTLPVSYTLENVTP